MAIGRAHTLVRTHSPCLDPKIVERRPCLAKVVPVEWKIMEQVFRGGGSDIICGICDASKRLQRRLHVIY